MTRRHFSFLCEGEELAATLDHGAGTTGLLVVSGGNELRAGAFSGQAHLAARLAGVGFPVFRFDRRGVGDSSGLNRGFLHSGPDIRAAVASFRAQAPHLRRIVGYGICDAATALVLTANAGLNALILANPWVQDDTGIEAPHPPATIRARYREKLRRPAEWRRLLTGGISPAKLLRGLTTAARPNAARPTPLANALQHGITAFGGPVHILLAERDRTAQIFTAQWEKADPHVACCPGASHAFAEKDAKEWLYNQIVKHLT